MPHAIRCLAGTAALALLAACGTSDPVRDYAQYDRLLIETGRHRVERDPADAPWTSRDVAENFVAIALAVEEMGDQRGSTQPLRRWETPIVWSVMGSASAEDRVAVARFMRRLARVSGHPIRQGGNQINMPILFLSESERAEELARVSGAEGPAMAFFAAFLARDDAENPCRGTLRHNDRFEIVFAAVLIKSEVTGRLRQACIEEELAQSMGLTNDSVLVRPSIFNDDQEFALLTRHDETLLRMLYDPRLRPGMTVAEVRPLLPAIAADATRAEAR